MAHLCGWVMAADLAGTEKGKTMSANTKNRRYSYKLEAAFEELATSRRAVHPNYYMGSRRCPRKSVDYAENLVEKLTDLGMRRGKHFMSGNDAPRGGHTGEWVKLTPLGRRRKAIKDSKAKAGTLAQVPPEPATPTAKPFDFEGFGDREIMEIWHRTGAVHPAPAEVLEIKRRSGASWKTINDQFQESYQGDRQGCYVV